jgi:hypothetical protein
LVSLRIGASSFPPSISSTNASYYAARKNGQAEQGPKKKYQRVRGILEQLLEHYSSDKALFSEFKSQISTPGMMIVGLYVRKQNM